MKFGGLATGDRPDVRDLRMEFSSSGLADTMVTSEHDDLVSCVEELIYLNRQTWKLEPNSSENSFDHLVQAAIWAAIRQRRILG